MQFETDYSGNIFPASLSLSLPLNFTSANNIISYWRRGRAFNFHNNNIIILCGQSLKEGRGRAWEWG